jgi:hypothetical protein
LWRGPTPALHSGKMESDAGEAPAPHKNESGLRLAAGSFLPEMLGGVREMKL